MRKYNVAIVGATGIVGLETIKILSERKFPVSELRLFASAESAGKSIEYQSKKIEVKEINNNAFKDIDIAFFAVDGSISRKWAPVAVKSGAVVIDKSSAFRMDKNVPLVIPEINFNAIKSHHRIIASPNCSTIPLAMVLKPLNDYAKVKRVVVSTYQSVSGAGLKAVQEMEKQTKCVLRYASCVMRQVPDTRHTPYGASNTEVVPLGTTHNAQRPFAFNAIPQIDSFGSDDYTGEETKMIQETRKILNDYSIKITATCVRIPVYCGHSESVNIETAKPMTIATVRRLLSNTKGIKVMDNPRGKLQTPNSKLQTPKYPMPIDVAGKDDVYVGRIRKDPTVKNGLNLWLVSDNLRKGAALNAVQIAEYIISSKK